jgi:hypothetical protein
MVPVEWPIAAADEGGGPAAARFAGRGRLRTARMDFFLDPRARLSEQERALMSGMLADLVDTLADEIRSGLAGSEAANDEDDQLLQQLRDAGLLDIPDLIALLLRRAEEERLGAALSGPSPKGRQRYIQSLVSDEDSQVSAAAMALILARSRRRDRFERPRVIFDDLSAEAAAALIAAVAAAVRVDLLKRVGAPEADERIARASHSVLSRHDEGNRMEARLFELVHSLDEAGRLDEQFFGSSLDEGEISLLAEALGRRAGIGLESAWELFLGERGKLALLLRFAGVARPVAGDVIVRLSEVLGSDPEAEISIFDALAEDEVETARNRCRLDPLYRAAIDSLAGGHGKRSV